VHLQTKVNPRFAKWARSNREFDQATANQSAEQLTSSSRLQFGTERLAMSESYLQYLKVDK